MRKVSMAILTQLTLLACESAYGLMPTFVQGAAFLDTTFAATSVNVTFAVLPAAGNAIIVGCMGDGGSKTLSAGGVTDNQSNVYKQVVFQSYVGSGQPTAIYIATNIAVTGPLTVTCAGVDQVDALDIFAAEFSGLAAADVLDGISADTAQSGPYPRMCGYVTTTTPNALIIALFNNDSGDNPAGILPIDSYSFVGCTGGANGQCAAQDGSMYQVGAMISAVSGQPGTYSPGFAAGPGGNGSQSICVAAAFKAAAD
jgi:hypothetical protein